MVCCRRTHDMCQPIGLAWHDFAWQKSQTCTSPPNEGDVMWQTCDKLLSHVCHINAFMHSNDKHIIICPPLVAVWCDIRVTICHTSLPPWELLGNKGLDISAVQIPIVTECFRPVELSQWISAVNFPPVIIGCSIYIYRTWIKVIQVILMHTIIFPRPCHTMEYMSMVTTMWIWVMWTQIPMPSLQLSHRQQWMFSGDISQCREDVWNWKPSLHWHTSQWRSFDWTMKQPTCPPFLPCQVGSGLVALKCGHLSQCWLLMNSSSSDMSVSWLSWEVLHSSPFAVASGTATTSQLQVCQATACNDQDATATMAFSTGRAAQR